MTQVILITGGARSGKSNYALNRALEAGARRPVFVATAKPLDREMAARIEAHRQSRPPVFRTVEAALELPEKLTELGSEPDVVIVDCLTLWLSNLVMAGLSDSTIAQRGQELAQALRQAGFASLVVSNEVGWGIVPDNALARRFRDLLGTLNQELAALADEVVLMVAGLPLRLK